MQSQNTAETTYSEQAGSGQATRQRRPRIAIMGEFSAGKSTLSNLLIGAPSLPVKVTATQLPPVWIAYGDAAPYRVDLDGGETPVHLDDLSGISTRDTQFIRVFHQTDALELCDLIDMPGISDPNMPPEVWERVVHYADAVIWCSHATQAWRQSEAAVWSTFPLELFDKSLLLLTRFDKITSERDRQKVIRRVEKETEGLFQGVYPISLTQALEVGDDQKLWRSCGAEAFATALIDLAHGLSQRHQPAGRATLPIDATRPANVTVLSKTPGPVQEPPSINQVMPRRVISETPALVRTERPSQRENQIPDF